MFVRKKENVEKIVSTVKLSYHYGQFWKKTIFAFNIAKWKRGLVKAYFPGRRVIFLPLNTTVFLKKFLIILSRNPIFLVWGMTEPYDLEEFSEEFNIPIWRIEDGFFRSIGLGALHTPPYSFCLDKRGLYYDSSKESDLEYLIKNYDWLKATDLVKRAENLITIIKNNGLSKYNETTSNLAQQIYGPKVRKRVLVIGQVEDDQSLLYGCKEVMTNLDLVELAIQENDSAQIIYKPHPDVMFGKRQELSNIDKIKSEVEILTLPLSFKDSLEGVDHVYTMTSLGGFEALMHGIKVTTVGAPFYSGWGLTDDRFDTGRRGEKRTIEQIFAAAYLLYPIYRNPETKKMMTLEEVIEEFQEILLDNETLSAEKIFQRRVFYNLAIKNKVNPLLIKKSIAENYVFITDSKDSVDIINGLAETGKKITVYTTRDQLANDESFLYKLAVHDNVEVISIHKAFSFAFSKIEQESVELSESLCNSLAEAFLSLKLDFLNKDVVDSFSQGFKNYIYFDILRYLAAKEIIENFDIILIHLSQNSQSYDVLYSLYFHSLVDSNLGKIFFTSDEQNEKEILRNLSSIKEKVIDIVPYNEVKEKVSSYWWLLQKDEYMEAVNNKFKYIVCGNLNNENYAYSPASVSILESLVRRNDGDVCYINSSFGNKSTQNEVKSVLLNKLNSKNIKVYIGESEYKEKYNREVFEEKEIAENLFFKFLANNLNKRFSKEFMLIYEERIKRFILNSFNHFIYIAEANRFVKNAELVVTSMENSVVSRILVAVAKQYNIKTVGIQPQIISTSLRYSAPTVDFMGVIDNIQEDNFVKLGYERENIIRTGSVNIFNRLNLIKEYDSEFKGEEQGILFAMQHSAPDEMINMANWLIHISEKNAIKLYIKPHPHQELTVFNTVKRLMSRTKNVKILNKDSDTYKYIAKSFVVVGLFSSVLYEAAIFGKMVIVASEKNIDDSIDFVKYGLALKAESKKELEKMILDFRDKGLNYFSLKESQTEYLQVNPQFNNYEELDLIRYF